MQINAFKSGWFRKRVTIACTLMATDVPSLERELGAFKAELHAELDHHGAMCVKILLVIAAGLLSTRAQRPAMTEFLQSDADLKSMASKCRIDVSFLNRMGDVEGKFRLRG